MKARYFLYVRSEHEHTIHDLCQIEGVPLDTIKTTLSGLSAAVGHIDPFARFKKAARRPGRPVRVVSYDANRAYVKPLIVPKVGEEFESLTDFSEVIGTSNSNLSTALSDARRGGKLTAFARGVEFGYVDSLPRNLAPAIARPLLTDPIPGLPGPVVHLPHHAAMEAERIASPFGELLHGSHRQIITTIKGDNERQRLIEKHLKFADNYGMLPDKMAKMLVDERALGALTEEQAMDLVVKYKQRQFEARQKQPQDDDAAPQTPNARSLVAARQLGLVGHPGAQASAVEMVQPPADPTSPVGTAAAPAGPPPKRKIELKIAGPRPEYVPPARVQVPNPAYALADAFPDPSVPPGHLLLTPEAQERLKAAHVIDLPPATTATFPEGDEADLPEPPQ